MLFAYIQTFKDTVDLTKFGGWQHQLYIRVLTEDAMRITQCLEIYDIIIKYTAVSHLQIS